MSAVAPRFSNPIARWLDERYELGRLVDFLEHKEVPLGSHSMVWY